jgi:hypothetical protein
MKIETASQRGKTTVRLSGQFQAEHIAELNSENDNTIQAANQNAPGFVILWDALS